MLLNLSKCEHLTITNKRNPINSSYKLNDQILRQVTKAKYLGVTNNQSLSWHDHITNICNKANSTRAFLQRNLRKCTSTIKSLAYNTCVRLIVEYASVAWSPHVKQIYQE